MELANRYGNRTIPATWSLILPRARGNHEWFSVSLGNTSLVYARGASNYRKHYEALSNLPQLYRRAAVMRPMRNSSDFEFARNFSIHPEPPLIQRDRAAFGSILLTSAT